MKVRKNEIKSPKSFSAPHWKIKDLHRGVHDFLRRDWFIFIMRQPYSCTQANLVACRRLNIS